MEVGVMGKNCKVNLIKTHSRTKHIDLWNHAIREWVEEGKVNLMNPHGQQYSWYADKDGYYPNFQALLGLNQSFTLLEDALRGLCEGNDVGFFLYGIEKGELSERVYKGFGYWLGIKLEQLKLVQLFLIFPYWRKNIRSRPVDVGRFCRTT